jgi:hypothetical protein
MLTTNSTLTELDVSDNWKGAGSDGSAKFAKELAVGLRDNGALSSLNLSDNMLTEMYQDDMSGNMLKRPV